MKRFFLKTINQFLILMFFSLNTAFGKGFEFKYSKNPDKPRGEIVAPIISFILPGADQWYEGQYAAGSLYTGYSVLGISLAAYQTKRIDELGIDNSDPTTLPINSRKQLVALGSQAYMFSGFLSAYHSFRSAANSRPDEYLFLKNNPDTLANLTVAPFKFSFLSRWTTFVPLGIIAAAGTFLVSKDKDTYQLAPSDAAFAGGISYHAGVGEEAFFRGFLYPLLYEKLDSHLWASVLTSTAFAAGHISGENRLPAFQFMFGTYMDYLTRRNKWSVQENIFIHFWWDVFAIGTSMITDPDNKNGNYIRVIESSF
jgi:membrane protease YdiL (CAAX protease family)